MLSDYLSSKSMEWLIISVPFLAREGEDEVMEARVADPILNNIRKAIVPRSGTTEISNTFESVGIELQIGS